MQTSDFLPLHYNESVLPALRDICSPLFSSFGFTTFAYLRFLNNGKLLHVSTNHDWLQFYAGQNLFNDVERYKNEINSIPENGIGYFLRSTKVSPDFASLLEKFDLWHAISIYIRHPNYCESYCFATVADNHQIHDLYHNNMDILKHFILYFKSKGHTWLDHSDSAKLFTTTSPSFQEDEKFLLDKKINEFLSQTKVHKFYFGDNQHSITLSPRQAECLVHLSNGKSTKEIGKKIGISHRTVETHLELLKHKVGRHTKSDLVNYFANIPDFALLRDFTES